MPITELRIEGLRTIEKVRLRLDGLTVLIGDNGTGKSSILEACEILRRATGPRFLDEFHGIHGGLTSLLRQGATRLQIGIEVRPSEDELEQYGFQSLHEYGAQAIAYNLIMISEGAFASIAENFRVQVDPGTKYRWTTGKRRRGLEAGWFEIGRRQGGEARSTEKGGQPEMLTRVDPGMSFLAMLSEAEWAESEPFMQVAWCVARYIKNIRAHLPFETTPAWAARALDRKSALRSSALLTPASSLEKLGLNLASAYHALKNNFGRAHWDTTVEYVRLGLGERIEDIVTWADPGGGNIGLSLKLAGLDQSIPASQLSDGMLSYLAFVALFRLSVTKPSLVTFDEPDLHLHPQLLMRVLDMFESMARQHPVLIATHSDRLLDGLRDPAASVVLCELDDRGATQLVRPDAAVLAKWLERYRGLGDIRGAGHVKSVLTKVEPA